MADNVTLPVTGTGDATPVIAADDVGGVKIQRVKIVEGADGVNDGDISSSNPLPVDTELPAATVLADQEAAPTTSRLGAMAYGYALASGKWDRLRAYKGNSDTAYIDSSGGSLLWVAAGMKTGGAVGMLHAISQLADGANGDFALGNAPMLFNGSTWDRQRGNFDTAALINASGVTTTQTSADQTNYNARGVKVVLDMTTVGTGSVTLEIQGKDAASGKHYAILTGAAVTTISTSVYTIYPGITAAANNAVSDILPRVWRVVVTANNANATTYKVGASVIL